MSGPTRIRLFSQRWRTARGDEVAVVDGVRVERLVLDGEDLATAVPGVAMEIRTAIGGVLRLIATLLVASPILLVPKLLAPRWVSDRITVGFVLAVVAFFITLGLYFIASFVWWKLRHRQRLRLHIPDDDGAGAREISHPSEAAAGARVRARGRVVAFDGARDEARDAARVVLRVVAGDDGMPWRIVEGTDFAVMPADGLPIVARLAAAPRVLGPTTHLSHDEIGERFAAETLALAGVRDAGDYLELAVGDEVEIVGVVDRVVTDSDQFTIDGTPVSLPQLEEHDPYRRPAGPAVVVGGDDHPRIVIRRV